LGEIAIFSWRAKGLGRANFPVRWVLYAKALFWQGNCALQSC